MRKLFALGIFLLMDGCGTVPLQPRQVKLALNVPVFTVNVGRGTKVFLRVFDERPEKYADPQEKYDYDAVAPILPANNLSQAIQDLLSERLTALDYELLDTPDPSTSTLDIVVQKLEYGMYSTTAARFHIDASMSGSVSKSETRVIDKNYGRAYEEVGAPTDTNPQWFDDKTNMVLSQLVEKLLSDLELLAALR